MRRLRQPGPAPAERIESVAGHGVALDFILQPGLSLNDALSRPLIAAGMPSGTLVFADAILTPFSYVLPGPSPDTMHAAYFSAPHAPGEARVEIANATDAGDRYAGLGAQRCAAARRKPRVHHVRVGDRRSVIGAARRTQAGSFHRHGRPCAGHLVPAGPPNITPPLSPSAHP